MQLVHRARQAGIVAQARERDNRQRGGSGAKLHAGVVAVEARQSVLSVKVGVKRSGSRNLVPLARCLLRCAMNRFECEK